MKIPNVELVRSVGERTVCELCNRRLRYRAHPHHVFSRGAGRVDMPFNLIALGGAFDCNCHGRFHDGNLAKSQILERVARREDVFQLAIEDAIYALRRLDKWASEEEVAVCLPAKKPHPEITSEGIRLGTWLMLAWEANLMGIELIEAARKVEVA